MRVVKIIIGILASIYAVSHLVVLVRKLSEGTIAPDSAYATGQLIGSVFGLCLGAIIAFVCFRRKKT